VEKENKRKNKKHHKNSPSFLGKKNQFKRFCSLWCGVVRLLMNYRFMGIGGKENFRNLVVNCLGRTLSVFRGFSCLVLARNFHAEGNTMAEVKTITMVKKRTKMTRVKVRTVMEMETTTTIPMPIVEN